MHPPTLAVSALAVATLSSPAQELPLPDAPTPRKVSRFAETNARALADGTSEKFEHPATFAEFFEREPRYVRNWLKAKKCPWELFEDFEQSLLYHMMRPVTNRDTGVVVSQDRLAHYRRDRMGNFGTRWAWAAYVNNCLQNEYGKLIKRNNRGFVRGENVVSLTEDGFGDEGGPRVTGADLPMILALDAADRAHFMAQPVDVPARIFLEQFFAFVLDEQDQTHVDVLRAIMATDTSDEVMAMTGLTRAQLDRHRTNLKALAQDFLQLHA